MDTKTEELAAAHMASGFVPSVAKWLAEEGAPVITAAEFGRWYEERVKRAEMSRGAISIIEELHQLTDRVSGLPNGLRAENAPEKTA